MLLRADMHLHTKFSQWKHLRVIHPRDSYNEPIDAFRTCRERGMDLVAFTDHDTIDGALDLLSSHPELEPLILVGEEVETIFPDTGQWVHVNVFDVDEAIHADLTRLKGNVHELLAYLRSRRLLHVLNHPFQSFYLQTAPERNLTEILQLFEVFESRNGAMSSRHDSVVAELLAHARSLSWVRHGIGGSDAHVLSDVACCWTEADVPDGHAGKREFLAAIAAGQARAAGRNFGALKLAANIHEIIGRYFLSLREPQARAELDALSVLALLALVPACLVGIPTVLSLANSLRLEAVSLVVRHALKSLESRAPVLPVEATDPLAFLGGGRDRLAPDLPPIAPR